MQNSAIRLLDRNQSTATKRPTADVESSNEQGATGFEAVFAQLAKTPNRSAEGQVTSPREARLASGNGSASTNARATEQPVTEARPAAISNPTQSITNQNHNGNAVASGVRETATLDVRSFVASSIARSVVLPTNQAAVPSVSRPTATPSANAEALLGVPAETVSELPNVVRNGNTVRSTAAQPQAALAQLAWRDHRARVVSEVQERQPGITEDAWETAMPKSGRVAESAELARPAKSTPEVVAQRTPVHQPTAAASKGQAVSTTASPAEAPAESRPASELETVRVVAESTAPSARSTNETGAAVQPAAQAAKEPVSIVVPTGARVAARVAEVQALMDQVGRQMTARVNEGGGTVRLRLDPPELGNLRLEVQVDQNTVRAQALVETARARALLVESLPQLRQVMAEQGLHLEQFSVTDQPVDQQQLAWSGQFLNDQAQARDEGSPAYASEAAPVAVEEADEGSTYQLRGLSGNIRVTA